MSPFIYKPLPGIEHTNIGNSANILTDQNGQNHMGGVQPYFQN